MTWKKAASVTELDAGPVVFNDSPKQIALFKTRGQVYAVDNRCPHEGYPLAQGHVDDNCMLTCNWHNWKFRLQDGKCILGGDHVRSYTVKTENGDVWIDVEDPPPEQIQKTVIGALETAFDDRDYGRICREITRLHYNQLDPTVAIRKAIEWSHDKFEFGFTHAYAASADWLGRSRIYMGDWEKQLVCPAEAADHMAFDALRQPVFPFAEPGEGFDAETFADAVETEQTARAEAMVQRGLLDGLHWEQMEQAFAEAALAHYNDFGHSLIYVYKAGQLLKLAGPESEPFILPSLARHLCYTTREDLLPEFSKYASALESLPEISNSAGGNPVTEGFFPGTVRESSERLQTLASSHGAFSLFDALLTALARNTLHRHGLRIRLRPAGQSERRLVGLYAWHHVLQRCSKSVHEISSSLAPGAAANGVLRWPQSRLPRPRAGHLALDGREPERLLCRDSRTRPRSRPARSHILGSFTQDGRGGRRRS